MDKQSKSLWLEQPFPANADRMLGAAAVRLAASRHTDDVSFRRARFAGLEFDFDMVSLLVALCTLAVDSVTLHLTT